jgi:hypothetical protein
MFFALWVESTGRHGKAAWLMRVCVCVCVCVRCCNRRGPTLFCLVSLSVSAAHALHAHAHTHFCVAFLSPRLASPRVSFVPAMPAYITVAWHYMAGHGGCACVRACVSLAALLMLPRAPRTATANV